MKSLIQSLDVSFLLHATEDLEKVSLAVGAIIGVDAPAEVEEMTGHFGNRIRRVSFRLHGEDATASFFRLARRLPEPLKAELTRDMDRFLDEHSALFLRLDKQSLVEGELRLGSGDAVRLKVKPRAFMMTGSAGGFFARLLEGG